MKCFFKQLLACSSFFLLLVGFVNAAQDELNITLEILPTPAQANSQLSRIVSDESGQIYLSWVSEDEDVARFKYSRLIGKTWNEPIVISEGANWFVNWADFPMLSVNHGNMASHWLQMSAEGTYDYDIAASFFNAGNNHWSEPRILHSDGVSAEHGFVSMLPLSSDQTLITWLDGRDTKREDGYGQMTLRAGVYDYAGNTLDEWEIDPRVCDCCQTNSAMTAKGPIVVFRDRSELEIRDISYVRHINGKWSESETLHADNWQIAGCPVNGPDVAANEDLVAVAWFTAKDDSPKVQLKISTDSGDSFGAPIEVSSEFTNGRVGAAILDSGNVAVSWIDTTSDPRIMISLYNAKGEFLGQHEVAETSASRRSGFPMIEAVGDSVYVSWTDISSEPQVKVARLDYAPH